MLSTKDYKLLPNPSDKYYKEMKEAKEFLYTLTRKYYKYWQKHIFDFVDCDEIDNIAFDSEPMETCASKWAKSYAYNSNVPEDIAYQAARFLNHHMIERFNKKDTIDGYCFIVNGGERGGNR